MTPESLFPLLRNPPSREVWQRFFDKVKIENDFMGCWVWSASLSKSYGQFGWQKR